MESLDILPFLHDWSLCTIARLLIFLGLKGYLLDFSISNRFAISIKLSKSLKFSNLLKIRWTSSKIMQVWFANN